MKLEDQVCSLKYAKRLKELGVKQDGLFYYRNEPFNDDPTECIVLKITEQISDDNSNSIINTYEDDGDYPKYSAFTISELGELIPAKIKNKLEIEFYFKIYKTYEDKWCCGYIDKTNKI